ncbi:DUF577 domain-containing protein [Streptomyces canus]|uniref:hypothetical protein n=1 Tax=Streptomyces canus TaxID=58343 RepID=UPI002E2A9FB0|nr:hypothetical protein [Streptomyces canus]
MDGAWVFAVIGVVGGAIHVLNTTLDQIPRMADRMVKAARAMREAKAALKALRGK